MRAQRFQSRRYQLNKQAVRALSSGHPWIYRNQLSSAASVFRDGQWLALYDGGNTLVGYGIHQKSGLQGIRVFAKDREFPTQASVAEKIRAALNRRQILFAETNSFRALHGENDGIPGVCFDVYGKIGVLQIYSSAVENLGRFAARVLRKELGLHGVIWRTPRRRADQKREPSRTLYGRVPEFVTCLEGGNQFAVDLSSGQKSGSFLDLRGLRRWLAKQDLSGKSVLNLFSYTGSLGKLAADRGAALVVNVDASASALEFGEKHHGAPAMQWTKKDLFDEKEDFLAGQTFDLILCDPPAMASTRKAIPASMRAYTNLHRWADSRLKAGGTIVTTCCTARLPRRDFFDLCLKSLGPSYSFQGELKPEKDHPVGFPEADYLKILFFLKRVTQFSG